MRLLLKKTLLIFGSLLAAVVLLFATPRIYERLHFVNTEASIGLNEIPIDRLTHSVVNCLNYRNRAQAWWGWTSPDILKAHKGFGDPWSSTQDFIGGRIGWHVTWEVILSIEPGKVTAYETYGAEGFLDGDIFRMALPTRVIGALKRCGVYYGGIYPGKIPNYLL